MGRGLRHKTGRHRRAASLIASQTGLPWDPGSWYFIAGGGRIQIGHFYLRIVHIYRRYEMIFSEPGREIVHTRREVFSTMSANNLTPTTFSAAVNAQTAVDELIAKIRDRSDTVRTDAWRSAGEVGAPAVEPLAAVMQDESQEVARAAKRGLWQIVRHSGRPGAELERNAVCAALNALLSDQQRDSVRREVLWMLSEIGGDETVTAVASLLGNADLREDARMALERIPGDASLQALQAALESAPQDFKINIAQSLRKRGVEVPGLPCEKLVPTKTTEVEPS